MLAIVNIQQTPQPDYYGKITQAFKCPEQNISKD